MAQDSSDSSSALSSSSSQTALVVKASLDRNSAARFRRITFPSCNKVTYDNFRKKIGNCFSLGRSDYRIAYLDDDGEETEIECNQDFQEAVLYFATDDGVSESTSASTSTVVMKVFVILEYDGPSLSETASSFTTGGSSALSHYSSEIEIDQYSDVSFLDRDSVYYHNWVHNISAPSYPTSWGPGSGSGSRPPSSYSYIDNRYYSPSADPLESVHNELNRHYSTRSSLYPQTNYTGSSSVPHQHNQQHQDLTRHYSTRSNESYAYSEEQYSYQQHQQQHQQRSPTSRNIQDLDLSDDMSHDFDLVSNHLKRTSIASEAGPSSENVHPSTFSQSQYSLPLPSTESLDDDWLSYVSEVRSSGRSSSPSQLSLVPDELLRCCSCQNIMDIRYICHLCGPIQPTRAVSDEGTHKPLQHQNHNHNQHQHQHQNQNNINKMKQPSLTVTNGDEPELIDNPLDGRHGFELCASCVELTGHDHALHMDKRFKQTHSPTAALTSRYNIRHAFGEVIRAEDSSWKIVEYDDEVHCTICGTGPILANRFKCISCPKFDMCITCYRRVDEIHPAHAFQAIPDLVSWSSLRKTTTTNRNIRQMSSTPNSSSSSSGGSTSTPVPSANSSSTSLITPHSLQQQQHHHHPAAPPPSTISSTATTTGHHGPPPGPPSRNSSVGPPPPPKKPISHAGVVCFGCLTEIQGPRYHCTVCPEFDLCDACERAIPPITSPDGVHVPEHLMFKIKSPIKHIDLEELRARLHQSPRKIKLASRRPFRTDSPQAMFKFHQNPFGPRITGHRSTPQREGYEQHEQQLQLQQQQQYYNHQPQLNTYPPPALPPRANSGDSSSGSSTSGPTTLAPATTNSNHYYNMQQPLYGELPPSTSSSSSSSNSSSSIQTALDASSSSQQLQPTIVESPVDVHDSSPWEAPTSIPLQPMQQRANTEVVYPPLNKDVVHHCVCNGCDHVITGVRWLCATCPTNPSYNLCTECEKSALLIHDPMHSFIRLATPLDHRLPGLPYLVPSLYLPPSNYDRDADIDETPLESDMVHFRVMCDLCMKPITGSWMRCTNCPESFDLCSACHLSCDHNPTHVFVKLRRSVDMAKFKNLTKLSTPDPVPLLSFNLYTQLPSS